MGLTNQGRSRSSSINPLQIKQAVEAFTITQNRMNLGTVEIGVYADFPSDNDQLLVEYREQLETLNERVNLLTVNNSRLKNSEHALKIDVEAMRRHLEQTTAQTDMLLKELN